MHIKITSKTSRISINGTIFNSVYVPRFAPPTCIAMIHLAKTGFRVCTYNPEIELSPARRTLTTLRKKVVLLARFEFSGDQTNFVNSKNAHDIDGPRHFLEEHFVVALNKGDLFRALLENLLHARTQAIPAGIFVVDLDLAVFGDLHHHGLVVNLLLLLLIRIGLRNQSVHALGRQRRDHHENNQKHQQNIDQRNDVHFRYRTATTVTYAHPHSESPVGSKSCEGLEPVPLPTLGFAGANP